MQQKSVVFLCLVFINFTTGLYIKPIESNDVDGGRSPQPKATIKVEESSAKTDEWSSFQRKLGLTDQKVEVLKSQKDQKATMELLNRFMRENPKYVTVSSDKHKDNTKNRKVDLFDTYHKIVQQLRKAQGTLKTSLNFELADKSMHKDKDLKRPRRKIAVRMVSDMPSDKIDDLLAMFNEQHGLNRRNDVDDDDDDASDIDDVEYNEINPLSLPSAMDPDYMYENLYEDEEDGGTPSSPYGSFQDLILQATRSQRQRELEETKLHTKTNEHFI